MRVVPNGTQRVSADQGHFSRSFIRIAWLIAIALLIDGTAVSLSPHPALASETSSAPVVIESTSPALASTAGNVTATSNPAVAAVSPQNAMYPEGSSRFTWSGNWSTIKYSGYSGGKAKWSKTKGASATFRFAGTRVAWIGPAGPTRGSARVYVDGKLVKTVSTWSRHFVASRTLFTRSWSSQHTHTLKIVVLGTAHHPSVAIDAIAVRSLVTVASPAPKPTPPPVNPTPPTPKLAATPAPAPTATPAPILTFDAECNGSSLDPRFKAFLGPGDPGDRLDTDMMGDLRQVSVQNGMCTTSVERAATPSGRAFAGAAMATYGTFGQKYGTFEARLRYDEAKGTWPSFFLLPVGQKGPYPEIDVFEAYGDTACLGPNAVTSAVHYAGETTSDYKVESVANSSDWHAYRVVWTASQVEFSIDGVVKFSTTSHVPQVALYPIFIFGVGAPNASCRANATTPSRLTMDVDYLRVYAP